MCVFPSSRSCEILCSCHMMEFHEQHSAPSFHLYYDSFLPSLKSLWCSLETTGGAPVVRAAPAYSMVLAAGGCGAVWRAQVGSAFGWNFPRSVVMSAPAVLQAGGICCRCYVRFSGLQETAVCDAGGSGTTRAFPAAAGKCVEPKLCVCSVWYWMRYMLHPPSGSGWV